MTPGKKSSSPNTWAAERRVERYSSLRNLSVSYEGYSESIITRMPDVSTQGMFINTGKHFPEGAVLNVRFRLARTGVEVRTRCEVRHCLEGVGIGVEFVDMPAEVARAIEDELRLTTQQAPDGNGAPHGQTKPAGHAKPLARSSQRAVKKRPSRASGKSRSRSRSGRRKN